MSSNFSPEDIARFQVFLHQLTASSCQLSAVPPATVITQPIVQMTSSGPLSSSAFQTPSSPAMSSLVQTGIPPITQLYCPSLNQPLQQGHPAPPADPPAFHPFIGTRLNLPATNIANQARLASASSSIPRQVLLPQ